MPKTDKYKERQYTDQRKELFLHPNSKKNKTLQKIRRKHPCGGYHLKKNCFFKDNVCFECGYVGHKSSHCQYKQKRKIHKFKTKVNVVLSQSEIKNGEKRKYMNAKIIRHTVKLLLDTGSGISIVNELTWKKIGCPPLRGMKK